VVVATRDQFGGVSVLIGVAVAVLVVPDPLLELNLPSGREKLFKLQGNPSQFFFQRLPPPQCLF
jgi:hypothetical protein